MTTTLKKIFITASVTIGAIFLYNQFIEKKTNFEQLSDHTFLASLLFLIVGTFLSILASGFFDLFQKNMKQFFRIRRKNLPKEFIPLSKAAGSSYLYWLGVGGILLILSILFLFLKNW